MGRDEKAIQVILEGIEIFLYTDKLVNPRIRAEQIWQRLKALEDSDG